MEKVKFEIYLEDNFTDKSLTRIDIFSHVKNEWILNLLIPSNEVFIRLEELGIKKEVSLIHLPNTHVLFPVFTQMKWDTKYFNGMSGQYRTSDGCIYELEYKRPVKPPKSVRILMAKKIKSNIGSYPEPSPMVEDHLKQMLRHGSWKKIA